MSFVPIKDGEFTSTIYGMIKDNRYPEVMRILQYELQRTPNSRAALSLLAYCYYSTQDFVMAAECYDKLSQMVPNHTDYKLYHAQSLFNAFMFPEALAIMSTINDPKMQSKVIKLDSAIKYRDEDLKNARILVGQYEPEDRDTEVNLACLDFKDGKYLEALKKFQNVVQAYGFMADQYYSIALCHYYLGNYVQANKWILDILDRAIRDYPELQIGNRSEGLHTRSVGNTILLHETAVIEALNLQFAIAYRNKEQEMASQALTDMPPRSEEELDPVTLHNQALINVDTNLADSFAKMQYLLSQNPFPPETFANLLLLYCKYEYFDLAADVLAENAHLTYKYLTQYMYDYLDAVISQQSSLDEAYQKFEGISGAQANTLRTIMQKMKQIEHDQDEDALNELEEERVTIYERLIPVVMAQAKIEWDRGNYHALEKFFHHWAEFLSKDDTFKLNVGHNFFMQDKYQEASTFYEPLIAAKEKEGAILEVSAIVLANLAVSYVMNNNNDIAEQLISKVTKAESESPDKKQFHSCIIHLVIGTLYCAKSNSEFGLSRTLEALVDCERTLGIDTWFYTKRCLLSVLEAVVKHLSIIRDDVMGMLLNTLENCEIHGKDIPTTADGPLISGQITDVRKTVSYEARLLRALVLKTMGY